MLPIILPMDFSVRATLIVKYDGLKYKATLKQFPTVKAEGDTLLSVIVQIRAFLSHHISGNGKLSA